MDLLPVFLVLRNSLTQSMDFPLDSALLWTLLSQRISPNMLLLQKVFGLDWQTHGRLIQAELRKGRAEPSAFRLQQTEIPLIFTCSPGKKQNYVENSQWQNRISRTALTVTPAGMVGGTISLETSFPIRYRPDDRGVWDTFLEVLRSCLLLPLHLWGGNCQHSFLLLQLGAGADTSLQYTGCSNLPPSSSQMSFVSGCSLQCFGAGSQDQKIPESQNGLVGRDFNPISFQPPSTVPLPHTSPCKGPRDGPANTQGERENLPGLLPAPGCPEWGSHTIQGLQ